MVNMPGPRTNPTVKPMANSNQRSLRAWQVTFGPVHMIAVLGLVTGCLAVAFYLGFFSGQKIGIETALQNNLATAMRLPIGSDEEQSAAIEDGLSDVYAKLGDTEMAREESGIKVVKEKEPSDAKLAANRLPGGGVPEKPVPELVPIQTASRTNAAVSSQPKEQLDAPRLKSGGESKVIHGVIHTGHSDKVVVAQNIEGGPPWRGSPDSNTSVRVLGGASGAIPEERAANSGKTLGTLAEEAEGGAVTRIENQTVTQVKGPPGEAAMRVEKPGSQAKLLAPAPAAGRELQVEIGKSPEGGGSTAVKAVSKVVPHGWFAQIVAPRSREEAETIASKLRGSGFPVVVENARVRGEEYFRVLVGPEENRQQAERLLAQLKREPYVKGEPFIRMVR